MSDELSIEGLSNEELKAAEQVTEVEKELREESLKEAFVNRIEETMEIGDTGYKREILFPIPMELIENDKSTKNFIKAVGELSRDEKINLPIALEKDTSQDIVLMNLVIQPSADTNLEAIKHKLSI